MKNLGEIRGLARTVAKRVMCDKILFIHCSGAPNQQSPSPGEPHGRDTKTWVDVISYIDEWKDGKMHGQGRYVLLESSVMEERVKDDEFVE
jgi:hypothetical protein